MKTIHVVHTASRAQQDGRPAKPYKFSEAGKLDGPARIQKKYQQCPLQLHGPMYRDSTAPKFPPRITKSQYNIDHT